VENLPLVFRGFHGAAFSTALGMHEWFPGPVIARYHFASREELRSLQRRNDK